MTVFTRVIVAVCMLAALALGAIATRSLAAAQQPENKRTTSASAAGHATIYFLRPEGMITPGAPDVELDGRKIGELRAGTYFVVKTPSGRHTLKIPGIFLAGSWEGDVTLAAGTTYFIELGTNQTGAIGMRALTGMLAGTSGQQIDGRGFNASYSFYMLNSEEGRAIVAKLKRVGSK